jgi:uncharacterized protein (DUF1778 family)
MTRGGKRLGAGRKPARDVAAETTIQVRVTYDEKAILSEAAARDNETLSAWLRRIAMECASNPRP